MDVSGGRAVDALSFEAEHFSIYAVISKENITRTTVEVSKDETFRVKGRQKIWRLMVRIRSKGGFNPKREGYQ